MTEFWNLLISNLANTTWLEFIAVVLGIASVWYAQRENILVYPTGIVSVLIFVYICFKAMLYADAGINLFYFFTSVYGWYNWTRPMEGNQTLAISVNTKTQQWAGIGLTVASFWAIYGLIWIFKHDDADYMQSYIPWADSFTTAIFLVGMLLMARKKVENWTYWIIGDVVSVPLYFARGLVFASFQYVVFLVIAVMGLIEWRRKYRLSKGL